MSTPFPQVQNTAAGIGWMLVTGLCFVAVNVIVKSVGSALPAPEAAFLRFVAGLILLSPVLLRLTRSRFSSRTWALFGARGVFHTLAVMAWFYAMARIPLAEATAMSYMSPVYVTLGAALFLGERLAARRLIAVAAALLGVIIILRPGFRELTPGHYAQLFATLSFAASFLVAKRLSSEASPSVIIAMLAISVTIGLAPFAIAVWVPPTLVQVAWLGLVAVFATAGHYAMARAFAVAPISVTQPVTFLQIVWAVLFGVVLFGEPVDFWVLLGGGVIIGAVSFIAWRESVLNRRVAAHLAVADRGPAPGPPGYLKQEEKGEK